MYRAWYTRVNWVIIGIVLLLVILGMITIYSATFRDEGFGDVKRQIEAFFVGLILSAIVFSVDYKKICSHRIQLGPIGIYLTYVFYALSVILLVFVLKKGHSALGAQRWIRLGPLGTFQPSEFAKLALVLALTSFLGNEKEKSIGFKPLLISGIITGIPLLLVLVQPDLGTSIVLATIMLVSLFLFGMNPAVLIASIVVAVGAMSRVMKPYQRKRLLIFLDPSKDPRGGGWNTIQSLIAVGSGRFAGKGLLAGTQTQLKFVPEHSTDFIFTVLAEELGFIGAFFMLMLYFFLLWGATRIALETEDNIGRLLAGGIVAMFFIHVLINVGMTMGVMPVTGIPLPFISSGGSSLITNMMAIALLLNVEYHKDRILGS